MDARSRAQTSATSVAVDAVSWMTPRHAGDRPTICRTQSVVTSSSSVSAGADCQVRPSAPRPVLAKSPRTDERLPPVGKKPKKRGWPKWVRPGTMVASSVAKISSIGCGASGGVFGNARATSPGVVRAITGRVSSVARKSAIQSTRSWPARRNSSGVIAGRSYGSRVRRGCRPAHAAVFLKRITARAMMTTM